MSQMSVHERIGPRVDGSRHLEGDSYSIANPATGDELVEATRASRELIDSATTTVGLAFRLYERASRAERADWCRSVAQVLRSQAEALAAELSEEHGKPLGESRGEVDFAIEGFEVPAREAQAISGEIPEVRDPSKRVLLCREPLGSGPC